MEDVVQAHLCRKSKAVSHRANALDNLERLGAVWTQLALRRRGEGMGWSVQHAKEHPCVHVKLHFAVMVILVPVGILLCLKKMLAKLF